MEFLGAILMRRSNFEISKVTCTLIFKNDISGGLFMHGYNILHGAILMKMKMSRRQTICLIYWDGRINVIFGATLVRCNPENERGEETSEKNGLTSCFDIGCFTDFHLCSRKLCPVSTLRISCTDLSFILFRFQNFRTPYYPGCCT